MNYWVLTKSGIPVSRTIVQRITGFKRGLEVKNDTFKSFDMKVLDKLNNGKLSAERSISPEDWKYLVDNN